MDPGEFRYFRAGRRRNTSGPGSWKVSTEIDGKCKRKRGGIDRAAYDSRAGTSKGIDVTSLDAHGYVPVYRSSETKVLCIILAMAPRADTTGGIKEFTCTMV